MTDNSPFFTRLQKHLHRGGKYSYWWTLPDRASVWWETDMPTATPNAPNCYFGVHPTNERGSTYQRSKNETIAAINCLFGEFDAKDFENDKAKALAHIRALSIQPSAYADSGGGYHCYWLLREPFLIQSDADRDRAKRLQAAWVSMIQSDPEAKDLARVLRVPGTFNSKYDPPRLVRLTFADYTKLYEIDDLESFCSAHLSPVIVPPRPIPPSNGNGKAHTPDAGGARVNAIFDSMAQNLAATPAHQWHETILRYGKAAGGYVASGLVDEDWAFQTLLTATNARADVRDSERALRDSIEFGKQSPLTLDDGFDPALDIPDSGCNSTYSNYTPDFVLVKSEPTEAEKIIALADDNGAANAPNADNSLSVTTYLESDKYPPLPDAAKLPDDPGANACSWLDDYIAFSRKYAPRAYDGFHEACAIWLLSTIASRRIVLHMGNAYYTPLYIALVARTTLFTKSTAADIAIDVLNHLGIGELMLPDTMTPQKLVEKMSVHAPERWDELSAASQERIIRELRFAGQRGWFYEEFGGMLRGMTKRDGVMSDFESLLRVMDDCKPRFESATIGRGSDTIENPYIALLGNMTPGDMQYTANKGNRLWSNGFWARWVFVSPNGDTPNDARFPDGERIIPASLLTPLRQWHDGLGLPQVQISPELDAEGKNAGRYDVTITPVANRCELGAGVKDAYYGYDIALREILRGGNAQDLDGNYGRLPVKAMRVAMLLASLDNGGKIEMRHWARAQSIVERWRGNLHYLVESIQTPRPSERKDEEDRIMSQLEKYNTLTVREIARHTRLATETIQSILFSLTKSGAVKAVQTNQTTKYTLVP